MKFRFWYVSMAIAIVVVLGATLYIGPQLCLPVEDMPCKSFLTEPTPAVYLAPQPPVPHSAETFPVEGPQNSGSSR